MRRASWRSPRSRGSISAAGAGITTSAPPLRRAGAPGALGARRRSARRERNTVIASAPARQAPPAPRRRPAPPRARAPRACTGRSSPSPPAPACGGGPASAPRGLHRALRQHAHARGRIARGGVAADQAALPGGVILGGVDQVVQQRVQRPDPGEVGPLDRRDLSGVHARLGRRRDQRVDTQRAAPGGRGLPPAHAGPFGVCARAHRSSAR